MSSLNLVFPEAVFPPLTICFSPSFPDASLSLPFLVPLIPSPSLFSPSSLSQSPYCLSLWSEPCLPCCHMIHSCWIIDALSVDLRRLFSSVSPKPVSSHLSLLPTLSSPAPVRLFPLCSFSRFPLLLIAPPTESVSMSVSPWPSSHQNRLWISLCYPLVQTYMCSRLRWDGGRPRNFLGL